MPRALRVCPTPGCPTLTDAGRCADCAREADRARGSFRERGYGSGWDRSRLAVLERDVVCVLCPAPAVVADHYPEGRRELVARGISDPDALYRMRGLCRPCHSRETARHQPGGWNQR
jgi:5-methylcytosine-specific restriction protein A